MNGYFYHGIESYPGCMGEIAQLMIKILNDGIIVRNQAEKYNDDKFNHVCLYRKNDEYDYNEEENLVHSARNGWINNCFVFIINPQIEARKATEEETDLVDEWRCDYNISPDNIVGIALPFEYINEYLNEQNEYEKEDRELLRKSLTKIMEIARQFNLIVCDSDKENFTDELDSTIKHFKR